MATCSGLSSLEPGQRKKGKDRGEDVGRGERDIKLKISLAELILTYTLR
jgi:hypothetical protein